MIGVILLTGVFTVIGILLLMTKIGFSRCMKYEILIDISVTLLLMTVFAGSAIGILTGAFTGGLLSLSLLFLKKAKTKFDSFKSEDELYKFENAIRVDGERVYKANPLIRVSD